DFLEASPCGLEDFLTCRASTLRVAERRAHRRNRTAPSISGRALAVEAEPWEHPHDGLVTRMTEHRPDPEALLARAKEEEARRSQGRLKLFFGAAAGVGKTYAMLEAARELRAGGVDVVVGYVETHGRAETAALLEGLEVLPLRLVPYGGTTLQEFDLDAALTRQPAVILVADLPPTNPPRSRHPN